MLVPFLVLEVFKPALVTTLLLVFEPNQHLVNSIATLFQQVFKQNVEDMYFYFEFISVLKGNSHVSYYWLLQPKESAVELC